MLPPPRETMVGCMWLPRIIAKSRLLLAGNLPEAYAARFCHPTGVDGQFMKFFNLSRVDLITITNNPDPIVCEWFLFQEGVGEKSIQQWNHLAENLGRPGFPMADRMQVALSTVYSHLKPGHAHTIFDLLDLDEGRIPGSSTWF